MKVSVLLPVYDAEATLDACLRSIARQRLTDFECVIIDDGSRDATRSIARAWGAKDRRFRLVERDHHGIVATLNAGIDVCRADIVARMDGDDLMHRDRLAVQLTMLETDGTLAAVGCRVRLFPRHTLTDGLLRYERWLNSIDGTAAVARDAFIECPVAHPTLMLRRKVLAEFRYRDRGWPEDWDLVARLLGAGERIGVAARKLLFWRDGPARLSRTHPNYSIDAFMACRAHFLASHQLRHHDQYVLWGYGDTGKALRRALTQHAKQPAAIVELHPGRIGQRIFGAPVIEPPALSSMRNVPILVSVAGARARGQIRNALAEMDFREERDFVCCA